MKRLLHIITGLGVGGAEKMLVRLLAHEESRQGFEHHVVALGARGPVAAELEDGGVPVVALGLAAGRRPLAAAAQLIELTRRLRPELIQGWMYHGNLASSLVGTFVAPRTPVVWNVRQSLELASEKPATARVIRWCRRYPWPPATVVYNSHVAADQHAAFGFGAVERVLANGFDLERFSPSCRDRPSVALQYDLDLDRPWVGYVARYHPLKDHRSFLGAARRLLDRGVEAQFVLAGEGADASNHELRGQLLEQGLLQNVATLGVVKDIGRLTASLDLAVSSSASESFPNAIGEAMAAGVLPVATDVGDVRELVGDWGRVVPAGQVEAQVDAWAELLLLPEEQRRRQGLLAREHMLRHYELAAIVRQYRRMWDDLLVGGT